MLGRQPIGRSSGGAQPLAFAATARHLQAFLAPQPLDGQAVHAPALLVECAWAAARSRDSYLSAQFWRLARRIGKKKAAMAVGHSILVIAWHLLTDDCDYAELGGDYFVRRDADRARQRAVAQLQALGYQVTLQPLAA